MSCSLHVCNAPKRDAVKLLNDFSFICPSAVFVVITHLVSAST